MIPLPLSGWTIPAHPLTSALALVAVGILIRFVTKKDDQ